MTTNKLLIEKVARAILKADEVYSESQANDPTSDWYRANPDNPQFIWQMYIPQAEAALEVLHQHKDSGND